MAIASNLAGKAINISKTTAPHAVSYPFTSLFNVSHGHAVGLFFEKFFKFNYENKDKSETSFDLKKRFDLIFNLFDVQGINDFNSKISLIKKQAKLEDNLQTLNINIKQSSDDIIKGINLLRLGNNPVKIGEKDIYNIISGSWVSYGRVKWINTTTLINLKPIIWNNYVVNCKYNSNRYT